MVPVQIIVQHLKEMIPTVAGELTLSSKILKLVYSFTSYHIALKTYNSNGTLYVNFNSLCEIDQKESPKEDVEKLILQSGGVKSLIGCLHGISSIRKAKTDGLASEEKPLGSKRIESSSRPVPDGLPKTLEELEEEERARMPDSPYTRLLRAKGRLPAWYSHAPDHETD